MPFKHHRLDPEADRPDPQALLTWRESRTTRWFLGVLEREALRVSRLRRSETGSQGWREVEGQVAMLDKVMGMIEKIQEVE